MSVTGSWITYKKKRWQGINRAVVSLTEDVATLDALLADIAAAAKERNK